MEFKEGTPMIEVSQEVHGSFHWGDSPLMLSLLARHDLMTDTVRKGEVGHERQRDLKQECHGM